MTVTGSFPAGRMVSRYRVSRRLGSGGFARVYCALDPDLELDVALKILRPELAADPDTVERFRREASMAAKLRHPNVITVLTVGRLEEAFDGAAPGTPYLVMDLLPDSLADRVAGGGTLPGEEVARIGAEVARGLAFAHRHGIVHRDVKPENVLFARDGRAVVTDFGIARAVAGSPTASSRQVVLGTPTYFSPEQARGLPLDGRSDIYALGVTLFRAVTGVLPFPGEDWYEVMRAHVETTPPRVRTLASVTPALDAVIARCLAKRPDDRFATADELATALEAARGGRPSGAATVIVPRPVNLGRKPGPAVWIGGAAAAVLAVVAVAAAALRQGRDQASTATPTAAAYGLGAGVGDSGAVSPPVRPGLTPPADTTRSARTDSAGLRTGLAVRPITDSARRSADSARTARANAEAARALPPEPALTVGAPPLADVYVDGVLAGHGLVRRDVLRPGRHVVRAVVPALPGCPSADTTAQITLAPGGSEQVQLAPVACGSLALDVVPAAARYRLEPARGGPTLEGELPLPQPLYLPAGDYKLTIEAAQCTVFTATVPVFARVLRTERARLICN